MGCPNPKTPAITTTMTLTHLTPIPTYSLIITSKLKEYLLLNFFLPDAVLIE